MKIPDAITNNLNGSYLKKPIKRISDFSKQFYRDISPVVLFVVVYGVVLYIPVSTFFVFAFSFKNILSLGISFYFIKKELPTIMLGCRGTGQTL